HSKLWCWVALDRAITLAQGTGNTGHLPQWERAASDLRAEIEARAWNPRIGAFTQAYDDDCLDAAVLQMPVLGFLPATDPRMRATIETLSQRLLNGPYVRRYDCRDDQGYLSAAFLLCSFWYVDGLIGMNRLDAAERQLAELIGLSFARKRRRRRRLARAHERNGILRECAASGWTAHRRVSVAVVTVLNRR